MPLLYNILTAVFLLLGGALMLVAGYGLYRMPDTYLRMSASTKASTIGVALLLIAAGLHFREIRGLGQVLITLFFVLGTAPIGAHILGRAGYRKKQAPLYSGTVMDELADYYKQQGK